MKTVDRPVEILLVEDNPGDVRLVRKFLEGSRVPSRVRNLADGIQALGYLRREPPSVDEPRPDLILLDLDLPGKDGRQVLAEIKSDPELKSIPVVVLTSSQGRHDIADCYERHANGYVTKPMDLDEFEAVMRSIESFWLATARLPSLG
jgi:CheY-like chemotaxis protein